MKRQANRPPNREFDLEPLESRQFLSVAVEDGILIVRDDKWTPHVYYSWATASHSSIFLGVRTDPTSGPIVDVATPGEQMFSVPASTLRGVRVECGDWGTIVLTESDQRGIGSFPIPLTIIGGAGDDILFGGDANDVILGQGGQDHIFGGAGSDTLQGEGGMTPICPGEAAELVPEFVWGKDHPIAHWDDLSFVVHDYRSDPILLDQGDILLPYVPSPLLAPDLNQPDPAPAPAPIGPAETNSMTVIPRPFANPPTVPEPGELEDLFNKSEPSTLS